MGIQSKGKQKSGWFYMTEEQRSHFGKEANRRKKEQREGWPKHVHDTVTEWDKRMKGRVF